MDVMVNAKAITRADLFFERSLKASSKALPTTLTGVFKGRKKSVLLIRVRAYKKDGEYLEITRSVSLKKRKFPLQAVKARISLP